MGTAKTAAAAPAKATGKKTPTKGATPAAPARRKRA